MYNGSPMGPGFFLFFNIQDTSLGKGFQRVELFEDIRIEEDEEVLELISIILTSRLLNG